MSEHERTSATAWPWRSSSLGEQDAARDEEDPPADGNAGGVEEAPEKAFFRRGAEAVARGLLGCRLVSTVDGSRTVGVVVETEAYVGAHDPASHAREEVGRTARNASMFGPAGQAYVYRSYGIHWCLNVVTDGEGDPSAVLLRALEPLEGREAMVERRGRSSDLCSGPGRLSEALGVTGDLDGHDLRKPPLVVERGWGVEGARIGVSGRIGVRRAADWPLRFYLRGHPDVSRSPST